MFSDLDEKPRFKEASYKIRFATSSLPWNFNKRLTTINRQQVPHFFSWVDVLASS
jgi:hypothetical protein